MTKNRKIKILELILIIEIIIASIKIKEYGGHESLSFFLGVIGFLTLYTYIFIWRN